MSLTVYGNILIDSQERLLRLKDSLNILKNTKVNQWHFNIRGNFKENAASAIHRLIKRNLLITHEESTAGWLVDSSKFAKNINSDFVLLFLEDHLGSAGITKLNSVISDMGKHGVDYVQYVFHHNGANLDSLKEFSCLESETLKIYQYDHSLHTKRITAIKQSKTQASTYLISMGGIFSHKLFTNILNSRPKKLKWDIRTPFDFERDATEISLLPYVRGVLKEELFTSIDDDHGLPGSCLISKKLYPERLKRSELITNNRLLSKRLIWIQIFKSFSKKIFFKI